MIHRFTLQLYRQLLFNRDQLLPLLSGRSKIVKHVRHAAVGARLAANHQRIRSIAAGEAQPALRLLRFKVLPTEQRRYAVVHLHLDRARYARIDGLLLEQDFLDAKVLSRGYGALLIGRKHARSFDRNVHGDGLLKLFAFDVDSDAVDRARLVGVNFQDERLLGW